MDHFITSRDQVMIAPQRALKNVLGATSYSLELYVQTWSHRNSINSFSFPSGRIAPIAIPGTPFQTSNTKHQRTHQQCSVTSPSETSQQGQAPKGSLRGNARVWTNPVYSLTATSVSFRKCLRLPTTNGFSKLSAKGSQMVFKLFQLYLYFQCPAGVWRMFYFCFTILLVSLICKCASTWLCLYTVLSVHGLLDSCNDRIKPGSNISDRRSTTSEEFVN